MNNVWNMDAYSGLCVTPFASTPSERIVSEASRLTLYKKSVINCWLATFTSIGMVCAFRPSLPPFSVVWSANVIFSVFVICPTMRLHAARKSDDVEISVTELGGRGRGNVCVAVLFGSGVTTVEGIMGKGALSSDERAAFQSPSKIP
ncbi:unnamed protein product [Periconia digitata]|uniref:Uncharacterized protein n=1 Tax=Periconia digitata TaxID=1303443 RepID=A0A9W4UUV2_9PLEO|nr:unnamed protein product [Periconia digitata]